MQNQTRSDGPTGARPTLPAGLPELLAGRPELATHLQSFQDSFAGDGLLDLRLLELCRTRLDGLHQEPPASTLSAPEAASVARGEVSTLSAAEQQALDLAEQLAIDSQQVSDAQVKTVAAELGPAATVTLLTAVAMHDANLRMRKVLAALQTTRTRR